MGKRKLPRPFWTLWAGALVNRVGTFVAPFLALYLTERRGLTAGQTGLVVALYSVGAACSELVAGWLADHLGRRATMVGALLLGGLAMIALGLVERLEVIAPATFAVGFFGQAYRPALVAAVTDLVEPEDRMRAFNLMYWVANLGFAIGGTLAGFVASLSYLALFVGDGATTLLFAFIVFRGVPETLPSRQVDRAEGRPREGPISSTLGGAQPRPSQSFWRTGFFAPFADSVFVAFLGLTFVLVLVFFQHQLVLPIDMAAHGVSKAAFGAILGMNGLIIIVVQPVAARLLSGFDRSRVIAGAAVLVGVGFGMNALVHTPALYALGVAVWTLGEIGSLPTATALVADLSPRALRGRYQGAYGFAGSVAGFVSPVVGSFVLEKLGATVVWGGCLGLALVVVLGQLALSGALQRACAARAESSTRSIVRDEPAP